MLTIHIQRHQLVIEFVNDSQLNEVTQVLAHGDIDFIVEEQEIIVKDRKEILYLVLYELTKRNDVELL